MKNALFRLSKYSGDKNVFNDYTINALQQTASQMDGYLNYACALGGQNGIPTLVSYADHTIHAIARRTGIQYSYAIIAMLLERLEMESLGERIIELQEDAPDWTSSRNQKRCVVALYDEYRDYFYYLHTSPKLEESKIDYITARQQMAISNFLGMEEEEINEKVNDVLQGNLREIVAEMSVMDVLTKRKEFAQRVMENSRPDLAKMGLEVVTFTIQDVKDAVDSCGESHGVVEAIGVQREMEVKRDAANARAAADRDIKIAEANAAKEANDAEVASKKAIAEKNNELALRQAELKAAEDKAAAEADAAGKIEEQVQAKTIKERTADAEIAAETKKIELAARAAEVERERLNAEVQKKADAALYESQRKADAQEYAQRKNADAALYAKQQEAEGIRKVAEAEAAGIKAKGIAEAEAMEKKAEAYKKYGQAAMAEMVVKILPDMAAQVAKSIEQIDKITIYGSDESAANSVDGVAGNVPTLLAKTFDTVKDATGIDLVDIVNAQSYDAQVNRHVKLDVASLPDMNKQSSQGSELKSNDTPDTPADKR